MELIMLDDLEGLVPENSNVGSQLLPFEKGAELIRASRASWPRALITLFKAVKQHRPELGASANS